MRSRSGATTLCDEVRALLGREERLHARVGAELAVDAVRASPEAWALLKRLEPRAHAHRAALEEALSRLHGRVWRPGGALRALRERVLRWLEPAHALPEATGDLCDVYALLSATAAAYLVLATSARALGDAQTVALAERHVDDVNAFLEEIALLLPDLARAELAEAAAADDAGTPLALSDEAFEEAARSEGRIR